MPDFNENSKKSIYKKLYKVIRGQEILTLSEHKIDPIIECLLYPKDYIMIVSEEKMGKTIIAQQLSCNLTTGTPFLNTFHIPKPVNTWYFITEGKEDDIKDRFIRMNRAIKLDTSRLSLIPTFFRFNTSDGIEAVKEIILENKDLKPEVIIIDSLYPAIKGRLIDEGIINDFHYVMRMIQNELGCAIILIHHFNKRVRTPDGKILERTDKDLFGSAFFAAAVDHVIWLDRWAYDNNEEKGEDKILKCDTQRSGKIFESIRIRLNEPDPLYFEAVDKLDHKKHIISELLKVSRDGMTMGELIKKSSMSRKAIQLAMSTMKENVEQTGIHPIIYKIRG